jgi:hypothetical protein
VTGTVFFRLLDQERKESILEQAAERLREGTRGAEVYVVNPDSLRQVPGSPFAYWSNPKERELFSKFHSMEHGERTVRVGDHPGDGFKYIRLWWEPRQDSPLSWTPYQKGGDYAQHYADIHLVVDWDADHQTYRGFQGRPGRGSRRPSNYEFFFRPGITWSRRSQRGLSLRVLPAGCVFADKGPAIIAPVESLLPLLGLTNSAMFAHLVALQMAFGAYEVGVIQRTPVPDLSTRDAEGLGDPARQCVEVKRKFDTTNEVSHLFILPALLQADGDTLAERASDWCLRVQEAMVALAANKERIDDLSLRLYELAEAKTIEVVDHIESTGDEGEDPSFPCEVSALVSEVFSYAIGCVFGRWDVRLATGTRSFPDLPDPFAPLPVRSPGMLLSDAQTESYPIALDADGLLVDDGNHTDDLIRRVRDVLPILFARQAENIETEACQLLGIRDLRSYFSNPRQFFNRHIQQYSKSRRKSPIYWLLQSPKESYGLWLYCHRMDKDMLFKALTLYVEPKIRLEQSRLEALTAQRTAAPPAGKEARQTERAIERQEAFLADLHEFHGRLQRAADLNLVPDLDDGVVLTMAPLWELVPWKEPKIYWDELLKGKYEWSSIGKQLREKGLVRA